jgi:hypothetical protein
LYTVFEERSSKGLDDGVDQPEVGRYSATFTKRQTRREARTQSCGSLLWEIAGLPKRRFTSLSQSVDSCVSNI